MQNLEKRLMQLERMAATAHEQVTIVRFVAVGETDRPMTQISHHGSGKTWHIAPGESERAFIGRVRGEINEPRIILLTS